MTTQRSSYKIAELLANGEQPWGALDGDTYEALRAEITANRGRLTVPVVLSARGRLLDGHHRLQIVQSLGRKTISADEVRIDRTAKDPESEALAAINFQRLRRQTTSADNARVARGLMRRFHWSQGVVAQRLGVSAAAVSQWLSAHPDPTFELTERLGADGKVYTVVDPEVAEQVGDEELSAATPPRRSLKGPDSHVARHRAEICNEEFAHWVISWATPSRPEAVERMATDLDEIAKAATTIADSLRAIDAAEPHGAF